MVSLICAKSMFFLLNVFLQHLVLVSVVCVGSSVSGVACGQLWWLRLQIKLRCQVAGTNLFNNKAAVATRCISSVLYRMKLLSLQTCKRRLTKSFDPVMTSAPHWAIQKKFFPKLTLWMFGQFTHKFHRWCAVSSVWLALQFVWWIQDLHLKES